jgi:predicted permease
MANLLQDLRYALRGMRKNPGFVWTSVFTLALGIGATTAVFSLVDTVLLHPLPFPEPDRIVAVGTLSQPRNGKGPAIAETDTSYPNFFDWRERSKSFSALSSWQGQSFTLGSTNAPARRIDGMMVASDFFRVLGVQPQLGRDFLRSDEQAGNRSVILSDSLWRSAFNANPNTIGQTLHLSDEPFTVVGVMPKSFAFPNAPDAQAWITEARAREGNNPSASQRGWTQVSVIGRLAPGITAAQAHAEMDAIQRDLARTYADDIKYQTSVSVKPELTDLVGDVQRPLHILFAAVSVLLLIACANVAGLVLTRSSARRPELALRSALGATRLQIVRQLLIESVTLSLTGGLGGFLLAAVALRLAPEFLPSDLPRLNELALNPRVLLFSLGAAILTGLLFGVLPAWRSSRLDPALALRDSKRSSTAGRSQHRLHSALVIAETALGLVLLIGAGLLIRSFNKLLSVDPGFNTQHLVTFSVGMPRKRFQDEKLTQLSQQLQANFATLPGVQQSTYAFPMPLTGSDINISFTIPGRPSAKGEEPSARVSVVAANFFTSMQMSLRRGRFFSAAEERPKSPPVMIINQSFADHFFPGEDPVGKRIQSDLSASDQPEIREIIGVVGNVNRSSLTEAPENEYYIPFAQVPVAAPVFALRVAGDPAAYEKTIRSAVMQMDPSLPVYAVRTNLLARSTAQQRFQTILISGFAVMALVLAAVGLYAVLNYMVTQRTTELGLRMALGAQRSNVLLLVLWRGLLLCAMGLALGLVLSTALSRYLGSLLFHTPPVDALTYSATAALLLIVSAAACLLPSLRAARLNPHDTLRQQ